MTDFTMHFSDVFIWVGAMYVLHMLIAHRHDHKHDPKTGKELKW